MPLLDVTSVLFDPDFADAFVVRRRVDGVDTHGRSNPTETVLPDVVGVITAASPNDLDRREGYQASTRSISIVTAFPLFTETNGRQPDIVVWAGSNFVVKHVDLYPRFGAGFFQVECESIDKTDPALLSGNTPQLNLSSATGSALIAALI